MKITLPSNEPVQIMQIKPGQFFRAYGQTWPVFLRLNSGSVRFIDGHDPRYVSDSELSSAFSGNSISTNLKLAPPNFSLILGGE